MLTQTLVCKTHCNSLSPTGVRIWPLPRCTSMHATRRPQSHSRRPRWSSSSCISLASINAAKQPGYASGNCRCHHVSVAKDVTLALHSTCKSESWCGVRGAYYSQYCWNLLTWDHPSYETFRQIDLKAHPLFGKIVQNSNEETIQSASWMIRFVRTWRIAVPGLWPQRNWNLKRAVSLHTYI